MTARRLGRMSPIADALDKVHYDLQPGSMSSACMIYTCIFCR